MSSSNPIDHVQEIHGMIAQFLTTVPLKSETTRSDLQKRVVEVFDTTLTPLDLQATNIKNLLTGIKISIIQDKSTDQALEKIESSLQSLQAKIESQKQRQTKRTEKDAIEEHADDYGIQPPVHKKMKIELHPPTSISSSSSSVTSSSTSTTTSMTEHLKQLGWTSVSKDTFTTAKGTLFSLTHFINAMSETDFSGILDHEVTGFQESGKGAEILCRCPEDAQAMICLAKLVCEQKAVDKLTQKYANLEKLKSTFYEHFGFAQDGDLLELLSLTSCVLNHPTAFGEVDHRADSGTSNRSQLLNEVLQYIDKKWPTKHVHPETEKSRPYWFPVNDPKQRSIIEERYTEAGFPLTFLSGGGKYGGDKYSQLENNHRKPIAAQVRGYIAGCAKGTVCINDEAPCYFKCLFPSGLYLVNCEYDTGTFQSRLKNLGAFAQFWLNVTK